MDTRNYRRALALVLPALAAAGATMAAPTPAQADPICPMTYSVASSWPTGFHGIFTLTNNTTTKTKGWRVEVHYRTGVEVRQSWNALILLDADPVYVFGNPPGDAGLAAGGSREFGVIAAKSAESVSNQPHSYVCSPIF